MATKARLLKHDFPVHGFPGDFRCQFLVQLTEHGTPPLGPARHKNQGLDELSNGASRGAFDGVAALEVSFMSKALDPLCSQKVWRRITLVKFKGNLRKIKGNLRGT